MAAKTILVVEDDRTIADLIAEILTDEGYTVQLVRDGKAALAAWQAAAPDLVLIDLQLPGIDGLAVVEAARTAGLSTAPAVLLTASAPRELRADIGAVEGYLFKPFALDELLECVARVLGDSGV